MSGDEIEQPEPAAQIQAPEAIKSEPPDADNPRLDPLHASEGLSAQIERFSTLSSDMARLLSDLSYEVKKSADQFQEIRSAVDLKKKELETLLGIEMSAAALERLFEDHRQQREDLERLMEDQRKVYEDEKARRAQEEKEYLENLKAQRQREEEEYKHLWAVEQLKAQQKLDEELKTIRQRSLEKQEVVERDCQEREQVLKERELEWVRLIQELEQFMSKLATRTQLHAHADMRKDTPSAGADLPVTPTPDRQQDTPNDSSNPDNALMWERTSGDRDLARDHLSDPIFGNASIEEPKPILSSLKEMLLSQGRRIESLHTEPSAKRDSAPLKFLPKKPQNSEPEV